MRALASLTVRGSSLSRSQKARPYVLSARVTRVAGLDFTVGLLFFGVALALALTHPWSHAYVGAAQYGDAAYWDFAGENWARGYFTSKVPDIRPGYSVFLGMVYALFAPSFTFAFVAQAALYGACATMLYAIGRYVGGRLTGGLAAVLFVLDPYVWEWTATSTTEMLGAFADLVAVYCLVRAVAPPQRVRWAAIFGVALGVANSVRPVTLPFVIPALLVLLLVRRQWTRRLTLVGVAGFATLVALMPGILYQYTSSGDPGLSTNAAANLFAASSPKYGVWTPDIYPDVAGQLQARGIDPSPTRMNAEFLRLTFLNYMDAPGFQVRRIATEFRDFALFEGEAERPGQYVFYRPDVLAAAVLGIAVLVWRARPRLLAWVIPVGCLSLVAFWRAPLPTFAAIQALGVLVAGGAGLQRRPRQVAMLAVALYWLSTGLSAIVTAGISGFLLHRLYTQVEPARALLLAFGTTALLLPPFRAGGARARLLSLRPIVARLPRLRDSLGSPVRWLIATVTVLVVLLGAARLVLANVVSAPPGDAYPALTQLQLEQLGRRLSLPEMPTYVNTASFGPVRTALISGALPVGTPAFAIPGQFTRFLWYLPDQDRTLFWYVFSETSRPAALDRLLVTGETSGQLLAEDFANREGLLVVVSTSAYFDASGDVPAQNVLTTRAFVPWDAVARQFQLDSAVVFPLTATLYDHARFEASSRSGLVNEAGLLAVVTGGPLLRALDFKPDAPGDNNTAVASVRYPAVWLPHGGEFEADVAVPPRLLGRSGVGPLRLRVELVRNGLGTPIVDQAFDPSVEGTPRYVPVRASLGDDGVQTGDVLIQVTAPDAASGSAELLVAEPRLRLP